MESKLKQLNDSTLNWIICYLDLECEYINSNNILSKSKSEKINSILQTIINKDMKDEFHDLIHDASDKSISESIKKKVPNETIGIIYFYRCMSQRYNSHKFKLVISNDEKNHSSIISTMELLNYKSKIREASIDRIFDKWNDNKKHISKFNFLNNANNDLMIHINTYMVANTDYYRDIKNIGLTVSDESSIESIKAYWLYRSNSWKDDSVLYQIDKFKRSVSNKRYRLEKKEQKKKPVSYMFSEDAISALNKLTEGSMLEKGAYLERLILREYAKFISELKY